MLRKKAREKATFLQGAGQGITEGITDNIMGIPEAAARTPLGIGLLGANAGSLRMLGVGPQPGQKTFLGAPNGREALSSLRVGGENLLGINNDGPSGPRVMSEVQRRNQVQSDAPVGHGVGDVGADIAMLAAGRQPLVKGPGGAFDDIISRGIGAMSRGVGKGAGKYGARRFAKEFVDSDAFKLIGRGLGRATEAGIEGMAMAVVKGADPVETAALTAGTQMAGSLAATIGNEAIEWPHDAFGTKPAFRSSIKGKVFALAVNAGVMTALIQTAKTFMPGGKDYILESEESAYKKMAAGMALGATLGVLGKRSLSDGAFSAFPRFADAINTIPRGAVQSLITDMDEDEDTVNSVLSLATSNPQALGSYSERLNTALEKGTFLEEVNSLMEDGKFREIVESPPELAGVPVKKKSEINPRSRY
jgi:hypothetical protein